MLKYCIWIHDMSAAEGKSWISAGDGIRKEMENNPGFLLTLMSDTAEAVRDQVAPAPALREVRDAPPNDGPSDAGNGAASARPAGGSVAVSPPATEPTSGDVQMEVEAATCCRQLSRETRFARPRARRRACPTTTKSSNK